MALIVAENGEALPTGGEQEGDSPDRKVLLVDGEWRISHLLGVTCLGHMVCKTCSCSGTCYSCKSVAPDRIVGMLKLVRYGRDEDETR